MPLKVLPYFTRQPVFPWTPQVKNCISVLAFREQNFPFGNYEGQRNLLENPRKFQMGWNGRFQ